MKIRISEIQALARRRPPGYLEAYLAAGAVRGEWLHLGLQAKHGIRTRFPGWGDRVHRRLTPIARLLDWVFGTHFLTCCACAARQAWLNELEAALAIYAATRNTRLKRKSNEIPPFREDFGHSREMDDENASQPKFSDPAASPGQMACECQARLSGGA
jgi:hypothetical protein